MTDEYGDSSRILKITIIVVVMISVIGLIISILGLSAYSESRDNACIEIGYNKYFDGKCIGDENYIYVYMDCEQHLTFNQICKILKQGDGE